VESSFENINRLSMFHILSNIPAATITTKYQIKGPSGTASTACATGLNAVGDGYRWIQLG
jgi:3-oxoacyl-[acyl-carrier-protein] synthase II